MKNKKLLSLPITLLLAASMMAGCQGGSTMTITTTATKTNTDTKTKTEITTATVTPDSRTIIDMYGNLVTVPYEVKKIATGKVNLTQINLILAGSDSVACLSQGSNLSEGTLMRAMFPELADLPLFTENDLPGEELLNLNPDLVMIYGSGPTSDLYEKLKANNLNVAICNLANEEELMITMNIMANALQGDALVQASKYETMYRNLMADVKAKSKNVAEADKPRVMYVRNNGQVCGLNSMPNNWIVAAGGINVGALAGFTSYGAQLTAEEILNFDPEIVFCEGQGALDYISKDDYKNLTAVKNGALHVVPYGLSCSGLANAENPLVWQWAANIIQPTIYNYDAAKFIKEFYKEYYKYDLSEAQLNTILHIG